MERSAVMLIVLTWITATVHLTMANSILETNITNSSTPADYYECRNGRKVEKTYLCDGHNDCEDGYMSDECECPAAKNTSTCRLVTELPGTGEECISLGHVANCTDPGSIHCNDGIHCVSRSAFCDGLVCCPDGSDEYRIGFGLKCKVKDVIHSDECLIPVYHQEDENFICAKKSDRCNKDHSGSKRGHCYHCMDGKNVITAKQVCDGAIDCDDVSDECLCVNIIVQGVCGVMYDVNVNVSEECKYQMGDISCGDGICIHKSLVCDGVADCANGVDEKYCLSQKALEEKTLREKINYKTISCVKSNMIQNSSTTIEAILCDGIPECDDVSDECTELCREANGTAGLPPFCSNKLKCLPGMLICDGKWDSDKMESCSYKRVQEEEINCPRRFYCSSKGMISIDSSLVCDQVMNCDDMSDETADRNCTDGRFYCETNTTLNELGLIKRIYNGTIFVRKEKIFNGKFDCPDASDECPSNSSDIFSSRTELISVAPLKGILIIMAVIAFFGNVSVIVFTLWTCYKLKQQLHTVSRCHHMLVLNLAIADLLMSIYLVALAIKSITLSGSYCYYDKSWRFSSTCRVLGVIVVVSSEMSVIVLVIMAAFRFATVYRPLLTHESKKAEKIIRAAVLFGWIVSILYAVIPLLPSLKLYFGSQALVKGILFKDSIVPVSRVVKMAKRITTYVSRGYGRQEMSNLSFEIASMDDVSNVFLTAIPKGKGVSGLNGLYGLNSVCLPRFFATVNDAAWEYSTVLLLFNFSAFFAMVVCYALIVKVSLAQRRGLQVAGGKKVPRCHLQKRVTRLLVTDFLCWIPICCIGFIYLAGVPVNPVIYAVCGIVILPINSAINPILYAGIYDVIVEKVTFFLSLCCKKRSGERSQTVGNKNERVGRTFNGISMIATSQDSSHLSSTPTRESPLSVRVSLNRGNVIPSD